MNKKSDFTIDEKIDFQRIKQFASQVDELPDSLIADFESKFEGDKDMNFYHGLIAGLAAAYSASIDEDFVKKNQVSGTIGAMLAFVSSKFKNEIE
jgi:hypothetical protein